MSSAASAASMSAIDDAAPSGERVVSAGRTVLVAASVARTLWLWHTQAEAVDFPKIAAVGLLGLAAVTLSVWIVLAFRHRPAQP